MRHLGNSVACNKKNYLKIITGVFWLLAYTGIIVVGFRDGAAGMPAPALCINIAWEFIFSFIYPHRRPQRYVNMLWLAFNSLIFYQTLLFGASPSRLLVCVTVSGGVLIYFTRRLDDRGELSALGSNLLMSALFILMFVERGGALGQSVWIALFKLIGTLIPTLVLWKKSIWMRFFGGGSAVLDTVYLSLLVFN